MSYCNSVPLNGQVSDVAAPTVTPTRRSSKPTDLAEVRRSRRMRWWLVGMGVLLAASVVAAAYVVYGTGVLAVRTISVRGATLVSQQDVINAADVPIGTPLARVDVAAVRARIEALPRVATAVVRRGWPHELVIVLHEYRPVAVTQVLGKWYVVDPSGVAFMAAPHTTTMPQVQGNNNDSRAAAITVFNQLPPSLRKHVVFVQAHRPDQVEIVLTKNELINWGDTTQASVKLQVLTPLMALPAKEYDVSVPSAPTVTR